MHAESCSSMKPLQSLSRPSEHISTVSSEAALGRQIVTVAEMLVLLTCRTVVGGLQGGPWCIYALMVGQREDRGGAAAPHTTEVRRNDASMLPRRAFYLCSFLLPGRRRAQRFSHS